MTLFEDGINQAVAEHTKLGGLYNDLQRQLTVLTANYQTLSEAYQALLAQTGPEVIYDVDFTKESPRAVTAADWVRWFGSTGGATDKYFADRGVKLVAHPDGFTVLRIPIPLDVTPTFVIVTPLPRALKDVTVKSVECFSSGIEWKAGGKGGVGVGGTNTTGNPPAGGAAPTNGMSLRDMWLSNGRISAYTYSAVLTSNGYGRDEVYPTTVQAGQWFSNEKRAIMNTKGAADGKLICSLNGSVQINKPYLWSDVTDFNRLMWAVFRGGVGVSYVSTKPAHKDFKSVQVTTPRV
jgi:hypothetical protein